MSCTPDHEGRRVEDALWIIYHTKNPRWGEIYPSEFTMETDSKVKTGMGGFRGAEWVEGEETVCVLSTP